MTSMRGTEHSSRYGREAEAATVGGAGGVVFRPDGMVLLLRHREGTWVFPKGHLDAGESALTAALREVEEEAGVCAVCPDEHATQVTRYENARGETRLITWFLLLTDADAPVLREALFPGGGFFFPREARERLSFAEDRRLLDLMVAQQTAPQQDDA